MSLFDTVILYIYCGIGEGSVRQWGGGEKSLTILMVVTSYPHCISLLREWGMLHRVKRDRDGWFSVHGMIWCMYKNTTVGMGSGIGSLYYVNQRAGLDMSVLFCEQTC